MIFIPFLTPQELEQEYNVFDDGSLLTDNESPSFFFENDLYKTVNLGDFHHSSRSKSNFGKKHTIN